MIADTEFTINIAGGLVFGVACALVAASRGRSAVGWFFLGLFLTCIALIILLCLPDLKVQEALDKRQRAETRRLREQIKKERQIADERHVTQRARLEAHDRALGLDTSADEQRLIAEGKAPPPLPLPTPGGGPPAREVSWFHADGGEQHGPIPESELRQLLRERRIAADTLVWRSGLDDWTPADEVPELLDDLPH